MKFSGRQKMSHIWSTYQFRKEFIKYAHWDYPLSFYIKCFIIWFKVINLRYIEFFVNFVRLLNTIMCSFILYINIIDLAFVYILKSSWPFFFSSVSIFQWGKFIHSNILILLFLEFLLNITKFHYWNTCNYCWY